MAGTLENFLIATGRAEAQVRTDSTEAVANSSVTISPKALRPKRAHELPELRSTVR